MKLTRPAQWLSRVIQVYAGERTVISLCLGVNFLLISGIILGRNARDALFLVYVGVQFLPYMYFANAAFLVVCSVAYASLVGRIERGKFLAGLSALFVASLLVSRLVLSLHLRWFYPLLYIQAQTIWYFSLMQFWTFVGDLFDTRRAKSAFPLIAVGGLLGMIGVGAGSGPLVHKVEAENLLVVWAALIAAATLLAALGLRKYRAAKSPADREEEEARANSSEWRNFKEGIRALGREPLQRSLAGYILLLWTVYAIIDFCFNQTMRAKYPRPNDLAAFFGHFVGAQGFLCLIIQLFFARAFISRLGVGTTINFHPACLVLGAGWMSLRYGFASVLTAKLADAAMLYTFSDSSYQLLYNPIPPDRRARSRAFIEGYVRPLSLAAAGALVLAGNRFLQPHQLWGKVVPTGQQLSWMAFGLAALWLAFAFSAKKGYIRALLRNLQGDSLDLRRAAATALRNLQDPSSLSLLLEALKSEDPDRVVAAVEFLETLGSNDALETIAALLTHPDAHVRATAAGALGRRAQGKNLDQLIALLKDPDSRVRANAIEALAATNDPLLVEKLQPLLCDASTRTRVNAVLAIAALQGAAAAAEWMPLIRELIRGDRDARSAAAYALARLPLEESAQLLAKLLNDPDVRIRCEAAQALGRIGSPAIIPRLVETLAGPAELRHQSRRSLAAILQRSSEEITRELTKTAASSDRPEIRSELADVLGRLKDFGVVETLSVLLKDPEWRVRWKVLKSFERLARLGPLPEKARAALFDYARSELATARLTLLWSRMLALRSRDGPARLLARALEEDRAKIQERVFQTLGVLCGREQMMTIFDKLNSGVPRLKADALEALDSLAPKGIAKDVLALLEFEPARAGTAASPEPVLAALAQYGKPWVRACTAYYLGEHPNRDGDRQLRTLLHDRDPIVRQTALYSGWLAFDGAWQPLVEAALNSDDAGLRSSAQKIVAQSAAQASSHPQERCQSMLLTVEKVLYLKSAPLLAGLDSEELAALANIALEKEYEPGEIVFEENRPAHHLYLIARGKVEVFHRADSREFSIALLGEGECFGEMAILDDQPRSASVRALTPTLALKIDRESFRELILERPQISFAIFKILSDRLRQRNLDVMEKLHALDTGRHGA